MQRLFLIELTCNLRDIKASRVVFNTKKIEEILMRADQSGELPSMVATRPGIFLREFYDAWVDNGGRLKGKNRNSILRMKQWLDESSPIKSLPSKLSGRTRLKLSDARILTRLFLSKWTFNEKSKNPTVDDDSSYLPFPSKDMQALEECLISKMFSADEQTRGKGIFLVPAKARQVGSIVNTVTPELYSDMLRNSDAHITISRHRTVLEFRPLDATMEGFWKTLKALTEIIEKNQEEKILIWIVDLGSRNVKDKDAWLDFKNVQILKNQLEVFFNFNTLNYGNDRFDNETNTDEEKIDDACHQDKLRDTLNKNAAVIIKNLRQDEKYRFFEEEYKQENMQTLFEIDITPEHLLPRNVPVPWINVTKLMTGDIQDLSDLTLSVSVKKTKDKNIDTVKVKYFTYSSIIRYSKETEVTQIELNSPGTQFDQAMVWACCAARYRLKARAEARQDRRSPGRVAISRLRRLGFEVLTINDFFDLFSSASKMGGK